MLNNCLFEVEIFNFDLLCFFILRVRMIVILLCELCFEYWDMGCERMLVMFIKISFFYWKWLSY